MSLNFNFFTCKMRLVMKFKLKYMEKFLKTLKYSISIKIWKNQPRKVPAHVSCQIPTAQDVEFFQMC